MNLATPPERPPDDAAFPDGLQLARTPLLRWLYVGAGSVMVVLGIIGLLLPIVPTTPFLLLAAFCYARGSARVYRWLLTNRFFGEYIRAWRDQEGVPLAVKIYALVLLWIVLGFTAFVVIPLWPVRVGFLLVGGGVTVYIVRLPTRSR